MSNKIKAKYGSPGEWARQRQAQQTLYPGQREALTRRRDGLSNDDIAAAMGVSKQTVASYLVGARVALGCDSIDTAAFEAEKSGEIPFYR
jgi:DNA-binding NarL/FixJ family response regulator